MWKQSRQKQFTLVELLVVVFIIGAILSLTFTALEDLTPSSRLSATARQLGDYISLARNEAAAQGKVFQIHYDISNNSYWMEVPLDLNIQDTESLSYLVGNSSDGADRPGAMPIVPLKAGVRFEDITLSQEIIKTSGKVIVNFTPFGFSAGHIVHLKSEGGQQISIEINGLTGISSYYDIYKPFDQVVPFVDEN